MDGMSDLVSGKERFIGRQMNLAGDPLELREIVLTERTADAGRPDSAGRATTVIRAVWI
jgi:hypothetical protein